MIELLSSTSLYLPLDPTNHGNYVQLTGPAIFDMPLPVLSAPSMKRKRSDEVSETIQERPTSTSRRKAKELVLPQMLMYHRWPTRDENNRIIAGLPPERKLSVE